MRELALNPGRIESQPGQEQALTIQSPQSTGLASGDLASLGVPGDLPGEQSLDSFGSIEFDTEPLLEPVEILGHASTILALGVDRPIAAVTVRLIDVAPDGYASLVARGCLNLAQRDNRENPLAVVPNTRYNVKVQLQGTAHSFAAHHRLRVAISTAYWPLIWPAPEPVTLTLFTGASRLLLPARTPQDSDAALPSLPRALSAPPSPVTVVRQGRVERSVSIDQLSGEVNHRLYLDGGVFGPQGKLRLEDIGLELAHTYERNYSIHPDDPSSARARMTQVYEMGRGTWQVRIEASAEMSCTPTTFQLDAWIEAFEGDRSICRRQWKANIPRKWV
jgi:hypothetical protein